MAASVASATTIRAKFAGYCHDAAVPFANMCRFSQITPRVFVGIAEKMVLEPPPKCLKGENTLVLPE